MLSVLSPLCIVVSCLLQERLGKLDWLNEWATVSDDIKFAGLGWLSCKKVLKITGDG